MLKKFVAFHCNSCSITPLTYYAKNPILQNLPTESDYVSGNDKRIHIDTRDSKSYAGGLEKVRRDDRYLVYYATLKAAAAKRMKSITFEYVVGKYMLTTSSWVKNENKKKNKKKEQSLKK